MRKLVDAILFYNELKMLNFRLRELYNVVDYFIIVECSHTYAGNEKEFYFEKNKNDFAEFRDKIVHIKVSDPPNNGNAWDNEKHQRRCIDRGIQQLQLEKDDLILIADCDEIPRTETLQKLKQDGIGKSMFVLEMDMYYYNFECLQEDKWFKVKILSYEKYQETSDPQKIRVSGCQSILNAGWHLSFFGDVNFIKNKIKNFSHQEYNNEMFLQDFVIQSMIDKAEDIFFRENKLKKVKKGDINDLPHNYKLLL